MRHTFLKLLCIVFVLHFGQLYAQDDSSSSMIQNSLNDLAVVGGCTAGGAVLGLSTLSFYSEPSDHYKNILYGAAVGLIIGVGLVAFSTATKTRKGMDSGQEEAFSQDFYSHERTAWHYQEHQNLSHELDRQEQDQFPVLTYSLTF